MKADKFTQTDGLNFVDEATRTTDNKIKNDNYYILKEVCCFERNLLTSNSGGILGTNPFQFTKIKVMSYNILGDSLFSNTILEYDNNLIQSQNKYFNWQYRKQIIIEEIANHNPNLICLQELDKNDTFIQQQLQKINYEMLYKKRTNDKNDGLAIFYNKNLFELVEYYYIDYFISAIDQYLNKDNDTLFGLFKRKHQISNYIYLIANSHILFNDKRGDIKIHQIYLTQLCISKIMEKYEPQGYKIIIFWCGDFNILPCSIIREYICTNQINLFQCSIDQVIFIQLSAQKQAFFLIDSKNNKNPFFKRRMTENNQNFFASQKNAILTKVFLFEHTKYIIIQNAFKTKNLLNNLRSLEINLPSLQQDHNITILKHEQIATENFILETLNSPLYDKLQGNQMKSSYAEFYTKYFNDFPSQQCKQDFLYKENTTYEPFFTSITSKFQGTIDYIWYGYSKIKQNNDFDIISNQKNDLITVNSILEIPKQNIIEKFKIFPNKIFPSDHFYLVTEFNLKE